MDNRRLETIEDIKREFCRQVTLDELLQLRQMLVRKIAQGNKEAMGLIKKCDACIHQIQLRDAKNNDFRPSIWDSID